MLASIPSPGSNSLEIGPLTFRYYGLMIALGVLAAVWLMTKRLEANGKAPEHATGLAMWAVPAGVVGARIYHVMTDWRSFEGNWGEAFKIWEGGLGILGGVAGGVIASFFYMRHHGLKFGSTLDLIAPCMPLAQAVGRLGNWFNQELFGRPSDLPWALEIDQEHRPAQYRGDETFHPTFLYESLWNIGVIALLLRLEKTRRLRPGRLFVAYIALYSVGRLWIEAIRIDTASKVGGLRINLWVFSLVLIGAVIALVQGRQDPHSVDPEAAEDLDGDPGSADEVNAGGAPAHTE